jgi:hypothetical protein
MMEKEEGFPRSMRGAECNLVSMLVVRAENLIFYVTEVFYLSPGEPYWCWFTLLFYYYFPITDFFTSEFTLRPFLDVNNMFSKGQLRRPYILLIANRLHSSLHYNICLNIDGCPDTSSLNNLLRNTVLYLCIIMFHLFLWKTISNFSMQKYFQSSSAAKNIQQHFSCFISFST